MQRGKKPDAPALKLVKGAPGADRANIRHMDPLPGPPSKWKPHIKVIWHEVANAIPAGVAGKPDRFLLELTVILVARMRESPSSLTPAMASQIRTCLGEMGLTPGARARIAPVEPQEPDEYFDN